MPRKSLERDPIENILPDAAVWDRALAQLAYEHVKNSIIRGARTAAAQYDIALSFDVLNPEVLRWLEQYSGLMANRVNDTVRETLRMVLSDAIANGERGTALRDRIMSVMNGEANAKRAEMIARTEIARAEHAGRQKQLADAGYTRKVWRTNQDACEFCQALEGMTVEIEQDFFKRGDQIALEREDSTEDSPALNVLKLDYADTPHPPLHPRCRCDVDYEGE